MKCVLYKNWDARQCRHGEEENAIAYAKGSYIFKNATHFVFFLYLQKIIMFSFGAVSDNKISTFFDFASSVAHIYTGDKYAFKHI